MKGDELYNVGFKGECESINKLEYTLDDIYDEIGYNESFAGNEGCMSPEELRDEWISKLFDKVCELQGNEDKIVI